MAECKKKMKQTKNEKMLRFRYPKDKSKTIRILKKIWYFMRYKDSTLSWIFNLAIAFIIIKFVFIPGMETAFSTEHPMVVVISESMEHPGGFDKWLNSKKAFLRPDGSCRNDDCNITQEERYLEYNITKSDLKSYPFSGGLKRGDIMLIRGVNAEDIVVGDVIVFQLGDRYPTIHRVIDIRIEEKLFFTTKGDKNRIPLNTPKFNESAITEEIYIGKAVFRIPYLGHLHLLRSSLF